MILLLYNWFYYVSTMTAMNIFFMDHLKYNCINELSAIQENI